jgi:YidC/Oxa1 family membrane protein insertase
MEKRAILAALLMAALLVIYQTFFLPTPPPTSEKAGPQPETKASRPIEPAPAAPAAPPPLPAARSVPRPPGRTAIVETPLYRAVVSSEGGKLQAWTLHYRGEKAMVESGELGPRGLVLGRPGARSEVVPLTLSADAITLDARRPEGDLVMTGEDPYGVRVRQTARFKAHEYTVNLTVRLENSRATAQTVEVSVPWTAPMKSGGGKVEWPTELVWSIEGGIHREALATAPAIDGMAGEWAGLDSLYYLAALVPKTPGLKLAIGKAGAGKVEAALRESVTLAPGQVWEARVQVYAGPKEYARLRAHGLEGAINFGGFPVPRSYGGLPMEWLGVPVLMVMHFFYRYIGNYGVAIILLTVVTKVLFFPLTVKSMASMKKMQAIQPQANAIRAKFKNDPQRAQRETLALYRTEGVNPLGGCLPMVIQVPIFYALYIALSVSVELQNAPFACFGRLFGVDLWICDLATHDPTYILPILMGITMFIQQKMTPTTGDPRQAKMMLVMPFVFTFMFLNLPSGLVLYWTVSNALQIGQQYLMNRAPARVAGREAKDAARA